jgi:hypothetical protein
MSRDEVLERHVQRAMTMVLQSRPFCGWTEIVVSLGDGRFELRATGGSKHRHVMVVEGVRKGTELRADVVTCACEEVEALGGLLAGFSEEENEEAILTLSGKEV